MRSKKLMPEISLIVPVRSEEDSIERLFATIQSQTRPPDEIIFVDTGSIDETRSIIERLAETDRRVRMLTLTDGTPGAGRNAGVSAAHNEWIAFTDAGITLEDGWLAELERVAQTEDADVVYGNYTPRILNAFENSAVFAYVPAQPPTGIRGQCIPSSLIRKSVCEQVGGFPDLRAGEDLLFIDALDKANSKIAYAPKAMVRWELRPGWGRTFDKFVTYSKNIVWAGKQSGWHYAIARQYVLFGLLGLAGIFLSYYWLIGILLLLLGRTAKRIAAHKAEYGMAVLFNPLIFLRVFFLGLLVDAATFAGWIGAYASRRPQPADI